MEKEEFIFECLNKKFPNAAAELNFTNNYELIVAVILSAQCTDKRVNEVTKVLFKKHPTAESLSVAKLEDVIEIIKSCGLFRNKAQNLINMAKSVVENFNGQVPSTMEELISLAGVGRKTANVVLAAGFNKNAIAVDTHVFRVTNRLGYNSKNPEDCEKLLMNKFKENTWSKLHYLLVLFGRYHCKAKNPECENCELKSYCKFTRQ